MRDGTGQPHLALRFPALLQQEKAKKSLRFRKIGGGGPRQKHLPPSWILPEHQPADEGGSPHAPKLGNAVGQERLEHLERLCPPPLLLKRKRDPKTGPRVVLQLQRSFIIDDCVRGAVGAGLVENQIPDYRISMCDAEFTCALKISFRRVVFRMRTIEMDQSGEQVGLARLRKGLVIERLQRLCEAVGQEQLLRLSDFGILSRKRGLRPRGTSRDDRDADGQYKRAPHHRGSTLRASATAFIRFE